MPSSHLTVLEILLLLSHPFFTFFFFLKDKKNVKRTNCLVVPELKRR